MVSESLIHANPVYKFDEIVF
jgi:deoxynucleoside triphosphate triphosphohydrolase SAMHD1